MTAPYFDDGTVQLYLGDCRTVLADLPDASVDAICTDPPYEISFMQRTWDGSGIAFDPTVWAECLRVLKPGGHLLAFGGTRTYHRVVCAIEDAGFEIRDSIHWIFGSGFPKGQDIAKSIDKRRDDRAGTLRVTTWLAAQTGAAGWDRARLNALFGFHPRGMATHWITQGVAASVPTPEQWDRLKQEIGFDDGEIRPLVAELNARRGTLGESWGQREVIGRRITGIGTGRGSVAIVGDSENRDVTAPASEAARYWQGWNTSLKPAHEPIVLARKSTGFNTTVANVLQHGTGALNVDGCRIPTSAVDAEAMKRANSPGSGRMKTGGSPIGAFARSSATGAMDTTQGRWPTNVVFTHQPLIEDGEVVGDACADGCVDGCPVAELDRQSGYLKSGANPTRRGSDKFRDAYGDFAGQETCHPARGADQGGASRFFPVFRYEAKAQTSERPRLADGTAHATVKPLGLMRWLLRLATPPGGGSARPVRGERNHRGGRRD